MVQSPRQPRDLAHEIAQEPCAVRRVHDFEMELRGVELPLVVGDHRDRRVRRRADHAKALRQFRHAVAVAHPDRIALALLPHAFEQRRVLGHQHLGAAEFAVMAALDLAAELLRHGLLAVADAEHRHAGVEQFPGRKRRVLVEHGGRPAGEDHRLRLHRARRLRRPSGTARSRNRPSPRAPGARSAASPGSRSRRSGSCRAAPWRVLKQPLRICRALATEVMQRAAKC